MPGGGGRTGARPRDAVTGPRVSPRLLAYLVVAAVLITAGVTGRGALLALGAAGGLRRGGGGGAGRGGADGVGSGWWTRPIARWPKAPRWRWRWRSTVRAVRWSRWPWRCLRRHRPRRAQPRRLRLGRDGAAVEVVRLRVDRWGRHPLGLGVVRSRDPLGLVSQEAVLVDQAAVRVRPGDRARADAGPPEPAPAWPRVRIRLGWWDRASSSPASAPTRPGDRPAT